MIKSYVAAKDSSVNINRASVFKLFPSQTKVIPSFKTLVSTKNTNILLNKSLRPVESLIKEFTPWDKPRNTNFIGPPLAKN